MLLMPFMVLLSCVGKQDPFVGRWTVEKVNVDFDENLSTPEMVRQYGEIEKGNIIEIGKDSTLVFISDGDTMRGKCSLRGTQLFLEGMLFGRYEDGLIEIETVTPLGEVAVVYSKQNPFL